MEAKQRNHYQSHLSCYGKDRALWDLSASVQQKSCCWLCTAGCCSGTDSECLCLIIPSRALLWDWGSVWHCSERSQIIFQSHENTLERTKSGTEKEVNNQNPTSLYDPWKAGIFSTQSPFLFHCLLRVFSPSLCLPAPSSVPSPTSCSSPCLPWSLVTQHPCISLDATSSEGLPWSPRLS